MRLPSFLISICLIIAGPAYSQRTVSTVAGGAFPSGMGAQSLKLSNIHAIAVDRAGNVAFVEPANAIVRRIAPDGRVENVAGTGRSGFEGDGGPAIQAAIEEPTSLSYDSKRNLYIFDSDRIRKVDTAGIITTVAGTGIRAVSSDGGPRAA